jgi:hypothetical protein
MGLVLIQEGEATKAKLNEELKLVVNDKWDFQARKMAHNEYMVVFPDKGSLETFSRISNLELSIYKLRVKISKSSLDPATSSVLKTCWVKISNVPSVAREMTAAKALASLVGQPLVVDELSLVRDEPIRVKVNCMNPGAINCIIEVFFNQVGHDIKFMAEGNFGKNLELKGGPPGGGRKDDKSEKKDPKDQDDSKGKKKLNKFDRIGRFDREQESSHGDSQDVMEEEMESGG